MCIEWHAGTDGESFHTIQGFLDCGHCSAIIPRIQKYTKYDNDGEVMLACPVCGVEQYPNEMADARVEEIMKELNKVRILESGLEAIRSVIYDKDIPSPTTPEYREWHENCQKFLASIDEVLKEAKT